MIGPLAVIVLAKICGHSLASRRIGGIAFRFDDQQGIAIEWRCLKEDGGDERCCGDASERAPEQADARACQRGASGHDQKPITNPDRMSLHVGIPGQCRRSGECEDEDGHRAPA